MVPGAMIGQHLIIDGPIVHHDGFERTLAQHHVRLLWHTVSNRWIRKSRPCRKFGGEGGAGHRHHGKQNEKIEFLRIFRRNRSTEKIEKPRMARDYLLW